MAATAQYFQDKSKRWRESQTCYEYVLNTQHALSKESNNADAFLQVHSKRRIIDIVLTECVRNCAKQITELNHGVSA